MREQWQKPCYVLSFYEVAGNDTPTQQRTYSVTAPDGQPVRILVRPFLTSRQIINIDRGRVDGEPTAAAPLRLYLDRASVGLWVMLRQQLQGRAFIMIADDCVCLAVFRFNEAMFPSDGIIELPGPWDADVSACLVRYAKTNYSKLQE